MNYVHVEVEKSIRSAVEDNFGGLTYTRGSDKMHPTFGSASRWMDSIAVWMSSPQTAHPIEMNFPQATQPRKWKKKFMFPKK